MSHVRSPISVIDSRSNVERFVAVWGGNGGRWTDDAGRVGLFLWGDVTTTGFIVDRGFGQFPAVEIFG